MAARASWRRLGRVAALVAAAALAPAAAMANGYLSAVDAGAGLLAQGRAREAVRAFEKARGLDLNDPLAAAGLGYALETDGQMAAGRGELLTALDLDPRNSSVLWADALSALNGGRLADAQRRLEPLRSKPELCTPDLWIALAYARLAAGDPDGAGEALKAIEDQGSLAAPQRSVAALVAGAVEYAAGRHGRAVEFLRVAAGNLPPTTFFDRVYTQRVPLLAEARGTGGPAPSLVSASSARSKARIVSGTVRLYLDPFRLSGAHYAFFYVDGQCLQTTNTTPLHYDWNTKRAANGYHKVLIRGEDIEGQKVGETEEVLLVRNAGGGAPSGYAAEGYARTEGALRRAMVLQPDVLTANYLLGISLARTGDAEGAATALEIVMGYDPDFGHARKEMRAIYAARNGNRLRNVSSVPTAQKKIALTFDDGPNPLYTPPLLDLLEHYKARCTMFLVGTQAEAYPDIVREIVEQGHEIADHTYSHPNLKTLDHRSVEMELLRCRSVLRRITGKSVELFRPPGGNADSAIGDLVVNYGFTAVYWDVFDSWLQKYDQEEVLSRLVSSTKSGSILLLHNGNNKTARIMERLLEALSAKGFQMVTVSELLAERTPGVEPPSEAPEAPELKDDETPAAPGRNGAPAAKQAGRSVTSHQ